MKKRKTDRSAVQRVVPALEKVAGVEAMFSLRSSQSAEVFRVSQSTLIGWHNGRPIGQKHRVRLAQVYRLSEMLRGIDPRPIGEALTWSDAATGNSLLSLLMAEMLDGKALAECISMLSQRIEDWWEPANAVIDRHAQEKWPPVPAAYRKEQ